MYYCDRHGFLWSGWRRRASSSAFTRCRATCGRTAFCSGKSSLWVTKETHHPITSQLLFWQGLQEVVHVIHPKPHLLHHRNVFEGLAPPLTHLSFTCSGKSPYPNVAVDTNFYKMIKDGRHMEQPDFAPQEMWVTHLSLSYLSQCFSGWSPGNALTCPQVSADDSLLESGAHGQTHLQHDWSAHQQAPPPSSSQWTGRGMTSHHHLVTWGHLGSPDQWPGLCLSSGEVQEHQGGGGERRRSWAERRRRGGTNRWSFYLQLPSLWLVGAALTCMTSPVPQGQPTSLWLRLLVPRTPWWWGWWWRGGGACDEEHLSAVLIDQSESSFVWAS